MWAATPAGKVPRCIRLRDAPLVAFAGVYDVRRGADGKEAPGFAIITTGPNALMAPIHGRMPSILPREAEAAWMDDAPTEELLALLRPYPVAAMEAYAVGPLVNHPANDAPEVLLPV